MVLRKANIIKEYNKDNTVFNEINNYAIILEEDMSIESTFSHRGIPPPVRDCIH